MRILSLLLILALAACADESGGGPGARATADLRVVSGALPDGPHDFLVDFGNATLREPRTRRLVLRNVGDGEAVVQPPALAAPFSADLGAPLVVPPGGEAAIEFTASLTQVGPVDAFVRLTWEGGELGVRLRAEGVGCSFDVDTDEVVFGMVRVGARATRQVRIANDGAGACTIEEIRTEGAAFSAEDRSGVTLLPGASTSVDVHFEPTGENPVQRGTLRLLVAGTMREIALSGASRVSCFVAEPDAFDLGTTGICGPALGGEVFVRNVCPASIRFKHAFYPDGGGDWHVIPEASSGTAIPSGGALRLSLVSHLRGEAGTFERTLRVVFDGGWTVEIPVRAEVIDDLPTVTETHDIPSLRPADVLLVVDDTTRMAPYLFEERAFARGLVEALDGADFQLGITTVSRVDTAGCDPAPDGRLLPFDGSAPRILDAHTPDLEDEIVARLEAIAPCHDPANAAGLAAAERAIGALAALTDDPAHPEPDDGNLGFMREDNFLALLFLVAGDDAGPEPDGGWAARFRAIQPEVWTGVQTWIPAHADATCDPVEANAYTAFTASYATGRIYDLCDSRFVPLPLHIDRVGDTFHLERGVPDDPAAIEVRIDGEIVPTHDEDGIENWRYSASQNAIRFQLGRRPPPASQLTITYTQGCGITF